MNSIKLIGTIFICGILNATWAQVEDTTLKQNQLIQEPVINAIIQQENVIVDADEETETSISTIENLELATRKLFSNQSAQNSTTQVEEYLFSGVSVFLEGKQTAIEKAWKAYLYKSNRIKLKSKKAKSFFSKTKTAYLKANEVKLTNITGRMGDLITVFQQENGLVKMTVVYKLGYNTAINPKNFPEENQRLIDFVNYFSEVNFIEYYEGHIKSLEKSVKAVKKEVRAETKALNKMGKRYKRNYTKKDLSNEYDQLSIEVQNKLVAALAAEKNHYEFLIMSYKNRNSDIRKKIIDSTYNN